MTVDNPLTLTEYSLRLGRRVLQKRAYEVRKANGQFLTPASVARFMARQLEPIADGARILDPAIGAGTLVCAVIDRLLSRGRPMEIWVRGHEIDAELGAVAAEVLEHATQMAARRGIVVHAAVQVGDFVLDNIPGPQMRLLPDGPRREREKVTHVIANPPYFLQFNNLIPIPKRAPPSTGFQRS